MLRNLRPITNNSDDRPLDRVGEQGRSSGSSDGVKGVASRTGTRSTTSSGKCTAPGQQRPEQKTMAAASRGHTGTALRQGRPSDNSSVALDSSRLDGDSRRRQYDNSSVHQLRQTLTSQRQYTQTAVRQLVRLSNSSVTLRRTHTPTTSASTTVATVVRHRNSTATRAQFQSHCVSVHVNRLTELLWQTLKMIGKGFVLFKINSSPSASYIIKPTWFLK